MLGRRRFLAITGAVAGSATFGLGTLASGTARAAEASTLDRIKASKTIRIGVASAEPWFFKDPMSGTWTGVGIDIGQQLAHDLGVRMVPVETTWANAVAALQVNQIDVMFVLDPTPERRQAIARSASFCLMALSARAACVQGQSTSQVVVARGCKANWPKPLVERATNTLSS